MSISKVIINHESQAQLVPFSKERPFCLLLGFERIKGDEPETQNARVFIKVVSYDGGEREMEIFQTIEFKNNTQFKKEEALNLIGVQECFIYYRWVDSKETKVKSSETVVLLYERIERLPTNLPAVDFDQHLSDPRNIKILFSAPYGQGKTTFLDYYFVDKKEYNTFRLFPVNYSVASNEDVFKYIKCELIIQLLEYTEDFERESVNYSESFTSFFGKNAHKIFAPLLLMSQTMGKNMYMMFEKWDQLKEEYFNYHESLQLGEEVLTKEYVQQFYDQEGGIFEDDLYTQMIRGLLERLKQNDSKKENILVIDDLDRMDPDHIFRILNVFSAHYDHFHTGDDPIQNKFGFDRVMLVCDFENIRHIYEHRYGVKTDFIGYINKYYSTSVFNYENRKVLSNFIKNVDNLSAENVLLGQKHTVFFSFLGEILIKHNLLSLRDLLKLRSIGLEKQHEQLRNSQTRGRHLFASSPCSPAIMLFAQLGSPETLINKLKQLKEDALPEAVENWLFQLAGATQKYGNFVLRNVNQAKVHLAVDTDYEGFTKYSVASNSDSASSFMDNQSVTSLPKSTFVPLLIENVEKYIELRDVL